jgi:thiamine biosynthesis lipoprotein
MLTIVIAFLSPVPAAAPAPAEVSRTVYLMGTRCVLTTYGGDRRESMARLESFITTLERTEAQLSVFRPDSELSRLNTQTVGREFIPSKSLCNLWRELLRWWQATNSAFDPAIGALLDCWGVRTQGTWPSGAALSHAKSESGLQLFRFDEESCRLTRLTEVTLDSGAFGKGEALDRIARSPDGSGPAPWLIDLGGQVMVHGLPPGRENWEVFLSHPGRRGTPALRLELTSGSISTSAGSERDHVVAGRRIRHILDPRTGLPAAFTGSVTVWHESALAADILSTALFVMGPDDGISWAEANEVAACFMETGPQGGAVRVRATTRFHGLGPHLVTDSDGK